MMTTEKRLVPPKPELFDDPGLRGAPYCRELVIGRKPQIIVCAAILRDGRLWTGKSHAAIIPKVYMDTGMERAVTSQEQGFLTDTELFVNRDQAIGIAYFSGQLPDGFKGTLFSEDLW